jgi:hypothetical protein
MLSVSKIIYSVKCMGAQIFQKCRAIIKF